MKVTNHFKLVQNKDGTLAEQEIKSILSEHRKAETNVEFKDGEWVAIITWEENEIDEENLSIKDKFHLEGERYVCEQCPYLEKSRDNRYKKCKCHYASYGLTRKDSECCDLFYIELANHKITPIEK